MFEQRAAVQLAQTLTVFVLRKKGSKTKERMKEGEIEKGDCGPPTRKVLLSLSLKVLRMVWWCIRLMRLTLVCEVIRYRLVQVQQNLKKKKNPNCALQV